MRHIKNAIIWGNHSATQVPDVSQAVVGDITGEDLLKDEYYTGEFMTTIQKRGAAVIEQLGASSALSAADAIMNHLRDWMGGSNDKIVSMGVITDDSDKFYGIKPNLCFSFPIKCTGDWKYEVVQGIEWSDVVKDMVHASEKELCEEREEAGLNE